MKAQNESSPLVSILVVTYNQAEYIEQTLQSLLNQDCEFDYEIVIGEDCSTDGTREICQQYASKHPDTINLLLNEQNKGFINNYFDVLAQAKGLYLADCGGDDYWLRTDKLRRQVEIMEQHPEVSMVFGNWKKYHQNTACMESDQSQLAEDWFMPERWGKKAVEDYLNKKEFPRLVLSTALFRADWTQRLMNEHPRLFRDSSTVCEDLPLTLGLLCQGPIYLMKEEVMVYRVLETSVSHAKTMEETMKGFTWKAFFQTIEIADELHIDIRHLKQYIQSVLPDMVHFAFLKNEAAWLRQLRNQCRIKHIPWGFKQEILCWSSSFPRWNNLLLKLYLLKSKRRPAL